jgi:hypothetical protein
VVWQGLLGPGAIRLVSARPCEARAHLKRHFEVSISGEAGPFWEGLGLFRHGTARFGTARPTSFAGRSAREGFMNDAMAAFHMQNDAFMSFAQAAAAAKTRDRRCMGCNHDGSEYSLEAHHRNKKAYGSSAETMYAPCRPSDLTTFCVRCHDLHTNADRSQRYGKKDHRPMSGTSGHSLPNPHSTPKPRAAAVYGAHLSAAPRILS